ncbi:MAG: TetR/AcrR family transcriptional regulator [Alistipes sp.]|nr:TetR/AcrR family transcriptional regulator [Alistipes sp.]
MTTQREKIVDHVWHMIITMGIKSVRMDDVANVMGMSKRTLYEMFGDKEELLYESIIHHREKMHRALKEHAEACDNALEMVLTCFLEIFSRWDESEWRLMNNMKKFYPKIYERVSKTFTEQGLAGLKSILIECRKEGYLARNVDIELVTMVFFQTSGMLMREYNIMLPEGVTREDAYGCMAVNFLRGVSSIKGIEMIDAILARDQYQNIRSERLVALMREGADNDNSEDN